MKYLVDCWTADATWVSMKDTLEEAKGIWCFGMKVYEIPEEKLQNVLDNCKVYKEASQYLANNCKLVHTA